MQYRYRCNDCSAEFTAIRKRCEYCGTVGVETDRTQCHDCNSWLTDSPYQTCPVCGSNDLERASVLPRE